jgi:hypothetical protein
MKYKMIPYFDIYELERELQKVGLYDEKEDGVLTNLLFGDDYNNDSAKRFYFEGDQEYDENEVTWQSVEETREENAKIRKVNAIGAYLQTLFPEHKYALIDVTW